MFLCCIFFIKFAYKCLASLVFAFATQRQGIRQNIVRSYIFCLGPYVIKSTCCEI